MSNKVGSDRLPLGIHLLRPQCESCTAVLNGLCGILKFAPECVRLSAMLRPQPKKYN